MSREKSGKNLGLHQLEVSFILSLLRSLVWLFSLYVKCENVIEKNTKIANCVHILSSFLLIVV
jgi:hypothetical protein